MFGMFNRALGAQGMFAPGAKRSSAPSLRLAHPQSDGTLTLPAGATFTRSSTAMVQDYAGVYQTLAADVPRFRGARYSGNTAYWQLADTTPLHPTRTVDGQLIFDTYPAWAATTVYALGARRIPLSGAGPAGGDGYWYTVTTAGTSGGAEPTWGATTTNDGSVVWTRGGYYTIAGYLHEQAATNSVLNSRRFDLWTFANTPDPTVNQTGIDGVANTAVTLTDNNDAGQEFVQSAGVTIPADTATHSAQVFVLKDNNDTVFPLIYFRLSGGTGITGTYMLNTKTGAITKRSDASSTGLSAAVYSAGPWWLVIITATNNGTNTSATLYLGPASSTAWGGSANNTAQRSAVFDAAGIFLNTALVQSPLVTTGSPATRAADSLTLPFSACSDTQGMVVADVWHPAWTQAAGQVLGDGTEAILALSTANSGAQSNDGTSTINGPTGTPSGTVRMGVRWNALTAKRQVAVDGVAGTEGAYDQSFTLSSLLVGSGLNGVIRNLRIYPRELGTARLVELTAKEQA